MVNERDARLSLMRHGESERSGGGYAPAPGQRQRRAVCDFRR